MESQNIRIKCESFCELTIVFDFKLSKKKKIKKCPKKVKAVLLSITKISIMCNKMDMLLGHQTVMKSVIFQWIEKIIYQNKGIILSCATC